MGEPTFRVEPEALVGPRIGVSLVLVSPGLGGALYWRTHLQG